MYLCTLLTQSVCLCSTGRHRSIVVVRYITIHRCMYVYIDLLAAHNDEGCPDNTYTFFQVLMPRKRPACIIAIMDNSRDLKTHTKRRLNERLNQAPQICSLSLSLYVILKIIDLFSLSLFSFLFFLVVSIFS